MSFSGGYNIKGAFIYEVPYDILVSYSHSFVGNVYSEIFGPSHSCANVICMEPPNNTYSSSIRRGRSAPLHECALFSPRAKPILCNVCERRLEKGDGKAEIDIKDGGGGPPNLDVSVW